MNLSDYLKELGVKRVYFSSGHRNASLLEHFDKFEIVHGFLDQSLAFQALGYSKASNTPSVVCLTSGSAVAQVLPALIEAYFTGVKLIVISADRPKELHLTGAPQSINQKKMISLYSRFSQSSTLKNLSLSVSKIEFPIHLNIEIDTESEIKNDKVYSLNDKNKTLIMINKVTNKINHEKLFQILKNYSFNIYQDVESPFYHYTFKHEIMFEKQLETLITSFDHVIRIGSVSNAKIWRRIDNQNLEISHFDSGEFKGCSRGEVFLDNENLFKKLSGDNKPIEVPELDYLNLLKDYPKSELSLCYRLFSQIDEEDESIVFIGNSMPIRYLKFYKPSKFKIMANRGANGIDGLLSTAIGVASFNKKKNVHIILGDLSFFYDENVLKFHFPSNLKIHVINNSGGRIFEQVVTPKEIINEHSLRINPSEGVNEVFVCNNQTNRFWNDYNDLYR